MKCHLLTITFSFFFVFSSSQIIVGGFHKVDSTDHIIISGGMGVQTYLPPLVKKTQPIIYQQLILATPNPCRDNVSVYIKYRSETSFYLLSLYSSNGALLKTWKINTNKSMLDISAFPDGVYFLKAFPGFYNKNVFITKLIKIH